jgi:hypothetical protein
MQQTRLFDTSLDGHPEEGVLFGEDVWAALDSVSGCRTRWLTVGGPDGEVTGSEAEWLVRIGSMFPELRAQASALRSQIIARKAA